ncbi:zinc finger BED domain-containing protein 4-like [Astyanax mexicanus]|uniref:zinc finger BED domain-containing protein 4-like n=1 Tax=Astyanax mexicanus TaxID=7994 RepID=UPI0020CB1FB0|nr:zinc finger BED domain-containing protein 4-like [Astyanax mexicanus]
MASQPSTSSTDKTTQQSLHFQKAITEKRKKEITDAIVEFIALDMRPINVVKGEGFKQLMKKMEPGYVLPKRSSISQALSLKYSDLQDQVSAFIENSSALSLTTDIWTSLNMEAYMSVTCHFINQEWELCNFVLATKAMEVSHTGVHIAQLLGEVAESFAIPNYKRVAVVHDNASNMKLSTETLKKEPEKWGNVQGVFCSGHTLQLCINSALKQDRVRRTISAARNLVGHFKKSAKATIALKDKQKQQNVVEHSLTQDIATRWNSTCEMLDRLLEQRWPVTAVLSDPSITKKGDRTLDLSTEQWKLAQDLVEVLRPLITLTEVLSQEENVSLSSAVPMLFNLKKRHLSLEEEDETPAIREMKKTLITEIDNRWQLLTMEPKSIYLLSSALDQRFKHLKFLQNDMRNLVYTEVVHLAEHLHQQQAVPGEEKEQAAGGEEEPEAPPHKKRRQQEISMLMQSDEEEEEHNESSAAKEMEQYLKDTTKVQSGPLTWWKQNSDRYPKLAFAAKYCLCVPATSTPSERILSKAGYIVNKTRSSLLPENVNKLVFLAHNMKKV